MIKKYNKKFLKQVIKINRKVWGFDPEFKELLDKGICYVIFHEGVIEGYALLEKDKRKFFELQDIAVLKKGAGLGSLLLDYIIKKHKNIALVVEQDNINAIKLYEKKGFKLTQVYENYYDINEDGLRMKNWKAK